jgi:hypothetical protein
MPVTDAEKLALDRWLAENVMGWSVREDGVRIILYHPRAAWGPTVDIVHAMRVWEKVMASAKRHMVLKLEQTTKNHEYESCRLVLWWDDCEQMMAGPWTSTIALAICLAVRAYIQKACPEGLKR